MPATTPKGYPYPLGTDRVMDGDDAIASLANAVDTKLGVAAAGIFTTGAPPTPNTPITTALTFPAGRFTAAPIVTASPNTSAVAIVAPIGISSITASGCNISFSRSSGTTAITVCWQAVQLP